MEISDIIVSTRTGEEITYAYYVELCNAYRSGTITTRERFDLELALAKFEYNSYYQ